MSVAVLNIFCCGRENNFQILTLQPGQELVDPLKPTLVHEDRPIADPCLGRHSSFESCDHDKPTREKSNPWWDKIIFLNVQSSDGRTYVSREVSKMRMDEKVSCAAMPSSTGAGIARRERASVSCRHPFKHRWNLGSSFDWKLLNDGQHHGKLLRLPAILLGYKRDACCNSSESLGFPCSLCSLCWEGSLAEEREGREPVKSTVTARESLSLTVNGL